MVRGYFSEMACVIGECARVLKPNARLFMVNDNVRYAGVSISVDIILSDIARSLGFEVEKILVMPGKKGNSSQEMGAYGRVPLRKCVYVWRRDNAIPPTSVHKCQSHNPARGNSRWKTAQTALTRIKDAFANANLSPSLFFIGAVIVDSMAQEIWNQLEEGTPKNVANLTNPDQVASLANWLVDL